MKITYFFVFSILLFSNAAIGQVGNTFVCKEKIANKSGIKSRIILEWKKDEFVIKQEKNPSLVDINDKHKFLVSTNSYFVSVQKYRDGYVVNTFDKNLYSNLYVSDGYTYTTQYDCKKF